jgi:hypothetical protein
MKKHDRALSSRANTAAKLLVLASMAVCLVWSAQIAVGEGEGPPGDPPNRQICPNPLKLVKVASSDTSGNYHYDYVIECDSTCFGTGKCKRITRCSPDIYTCVATFYSGGGCQWYADWFDLTVEVGDCMPIGKGCICSPKQLPVRTQLLLWSGAAC